MEKGDWNLLSPLDVRMDEIFRWEECFSIDSVVLSPDGRGFFRDHGF